MAQTARAKAYEAAAVIRRCKPIPGVKRVVYMRRDLAERIRRETSRDFDISVIFRPAPLVLTDCGPEIAVATVIK